MITEESYHRMVSWLSLPKQYYLTAEELALFGEERSYGFASTKSILEITFDQFPAPEASASLYERYFADNEAFFHQQSQRIWLITWGATSGRTGLETLHALRKMSRDRALTSLEAEDIEDFRFGYLRE